MSMSERQVVLVRVDRDLHRRAKERAELESCSLTNLFSRALLEYLRRVERRAS